MDAVPENPSCSPEVLGTTGTHPLLLLTLSASVSVSVPVLRLLLAVFFPSPVSQRSVDL